MDRKQPKRTYEVLDNGDVLMKEVQESDVYFHYRDFVTYHRNFLELKKETQEAMSEERIKELEKQSAKLDKDIKEVEQILTKSEDLTKKEYEKMKKENLKTAIRDLLKQDKPSVDMAVGIKQNNPAEVVSEIISSLSEAEKSKWSKLLAKAKRSKK